MAPRPTPAAKLRIPKIATIRNPNDETVFDQVTGAAAPGVLEERPCSRPPMFLFCGSVAFFAELKVLGNERWEFIVTRILNAGVRAQLRS